MPNFLTARYRRFHDKIKDVRLSDLTSKFPKSMRSMRILAMLEQMPILPTAVKNPMKYSQLLAAKIAESPYGHYWRKPWLFGYWTVAMILCFPILYKRQVLPTAEISARRLEMLKQADVSESNSRTEETARIAERNRGD